MATSSTQAVLSHRISKVRAVYGPHTTRSCTARRWSEDRVSDSESLFSGFRRDSCSSPRVSQNPEPKIVHNDIVSGLQKDPETPARSVIMADLGHHEPRYRARPLTYGAVSEDHIISLAITALENIFHDCNGLVGNDTKLLD